ncbi:MAG TPA: methylated-DNA--[protein]-cysteine S-methyltransferase [Chitinophagales bacterium]|nr:methylated-DNA--[protein]-cysteine S-methyltransferase [Chitinophagales bacterium]
MENLSTTSLSIQTPLGLLRLEANNHHLVSASFINHSESTIDNNLSPLLKEVATQLDAYFKGKLQTFDIPLQPLGTDFQKEVWKKLKTIPYGETISYLKLANMVGGPHYSRAVGTANGNNTIAIIIPCHRVIGNNGDLVGYSGGLEKKRWLIDFEKKCKYGIHELFGRGF